MVTYKINKMSSESPMYIIRQHAIKWWKNLSSLRKTQICDINIKLVGNVRRWETLSEFEIVLLYDKHRIE